MRGTAARGQGLLPPEEVLRHRLASILGDEFIDNAAPVSLMREGIKITGYAGYPTLHKPTARQQYLFVNERPVKDRLLTGALRAAYRDLVPRDRHPVAALTVAC